METSLDEVGGLIHIYFFGKGGTDVEVTVRYADQSCRDHPVLGPIIDHVLETAAETHAPLPTQRPGSD